MPYFCYIHRSSGGVPHFEVLPQAGREDALRRAAELLADRLDGERAEVWEGETLVQTLARPVAA
ncbi:hypothetical protein [Phenylobacterium sp.]|jgi:hypothetical protein|uniref:hypothetical protein n=1 Tax=Phenylobacterium sp. TaxID=1871053 RepID=UPI002F93D510